jgi:hypothetical protein
VDFSKYFSFAGNGFWAKGFEIPIGDFVFAPTYWEAGAIVFLVFLLILTLAQVRRHFLDWSVKGSIFGIFLGFMLAVILEGFLLISGNTVLTGLLGWRSAPKPISNVLDAGRSKLVQVLGTSTEAAPKEIVDLFQKLSPSESQKVRRLICEP